MWARIENEEIKEIIDFDPTGKFYPSIVWEKVTDKEAMGMVRGDGAWIKKEIPVVESQLEKLMKLLEAQE